MNTYTRPDFDLQIAEVPGGLQVTQAGRTYLARKWRLTPAVRTVLDTALAHGLTCLWQQGLPRRDESHHISFSFDRSGSIWVFVIGGEAGPPNLKRVTFNKQLKEYFRHSGLGWVWNWETAGGKNILASPDDLDSILRTLPLRDIRTGALPTSEPATHRRTGPRQFFRHESDLEGELFRRIVAQGPDNILVDRQRRFGANDGFEVGSRPDILVAEGDRALILELKLNQASDAELAQLLRYLGNREMAAAFAPRKLHGILIAGRFDDAIVSTAQKRTDISLVRYKQSSDGVLLMKLVVGTDALKAYLG